MKKTKLVVAALASMLFVSSLTGCGGGGGDKKESSYTFVLSLDSGSKSLRVGESASINILAEDIESHEFSFESSNPAIASVDDEGNVTAVGVGDVEISVTEEEEGVTRKLFLSTYDKDPFSGLITLGAASDNEVYTDVLGRLEKFGMDHNLTGISLYEDGGYVMYNPRVQKGTESYISGYGFGIQREGNITADLASETKAEWKRYYHSASSTDDKTINALNSKESSVSDLYAHISSSYWDVKMSDTKDSYVWHGILSKNDRPIPGTVDGEGNFVPAEDPKSTSYYWKFYVRTGADGLKYRTLSSRFSQFDNRDVALEDYKYGLELLLTQSFGLYRGTEFAGQEAKGYAFVGSNAYYNATKSSEGTDDAAFDANVKFKTGTDENGSYIVCAMPKAYSPFYAMYYMSSNLYQPICKDFILALGDGNEKLGVERYGSFVQSPSMSPVDTILSLGARTLEYWEEDKTIAFKTNDTWFEKVENPSIWKVPGLKVSIYPGATEDQTLVFKEFLAGKLDSAGIPTVEYLKQYRDDPRTTTTTGSTVFKLNMMTASEERWEELFGTNGIVTHTAKADYWDVKPWMSNDSFLKGLNASIDRLTYANNRGNIPSNNFFSSNYLSDPENGVSYNVTEAHKNAMKEYYPETAGYNLTASKLLFRQAVEELVEAGDLELGTADNPTNIHIDCWWMYPYMIQDDGAEIGKYIEDAFNDPSVCGGKVKLSVRHEAVTQWDLVYYEHLLVGQFDIGFGSVSGNSYDPLAFLDNLFQDGSSQFTLCWGDVDTSKVSEDLIYDGRQWSFQGLFQAANLYAYLDNGDVADLFALNKCDATRAADGSLTLKLNVTETISEQAQSYLVLIAVYAQKGDAYYEDYLYVEEDTSRVEEEDGSVTYTFNVSAEFLNGIFTQVGSTDGTDLDRFGIDGYNATIIPSLGIEVPYDYFNSLEFALPPVPSGLHR